jgi:hypothetical protein
VQPYVEGLLTRHIPNADDLAVMLPAGSVWWPGCGASESAFAEPPKNKNSATHEQQKQFPGCAGSEARSKARGKAMAEAMVRTCTLHAVLLQTLALAPATLPVNAAAAGDCEGVVADMPAAIIDGRGLSLAHNRPFL